MSATDLTTCKNTFSSLISNDLDWSNIIESPRWRWYTKLLLLQFLSKKNKLVNEVKKKKKEYFVVLILTIRLTIQTYRVKQLKKTTIVEDKFEKKENGNCGICELFFKSLFRLFYSLCLRQWIEHRLTNETFVSICFDIFFFFLSELPF